MVPRAEGNWITPQCAIASKWNFQRMNSKIFCSLGGIWFFKNFELIFFPSCLANNLTRLVVLKPGCTCLTTIVINCETFVSYETRASIFLDPTMLCTGQHERLKSWVGNLIIFKSVLLPVSRRCSVFPPKNKGNELKLLMSSDLGGVAHYVPHLSRMCTTCVSPLPPHSPVAFREW